MADISKVILPGKDDAYNLKDASARADIITINSTLAGKVDKAGDTMTGALTLSGAPSSNLHAATKKYVDDAVAGVSGGLVFKGTLGTGGTISTLPSASASNKGWMYKVITDGTYAGQAAKVGDLFISDGSAWVRIPSGDEPLGTVTNVGTGNGLKGGPITSSGTISIDEDVVAVKGDYTGTAKSNTTGISVSAHSASGSLSNGTTTADGTNAASSVTFSGTTATASKVATAGSAGTMTTIDTTKFNGGTPTAVTMASIDTTKFSGGSLSAGSFNGGSGSFTQGTFSQGTLPTFSATVNDTTETLTFAWNAGTLPTHGEDSHTHTAATHTQGTLTPAALGTGFYTPGSVTAGSSASLGTGFYTPGTAPTMPTFTNVENLVQKGSTTATAAAQEFTGKASAVTGTISVTVNDHTITDNGHTHEVEVTI